MDHILPGDVVIYQKYVQSDDTSEGIVLRQGDLTLQTPTALILEKMCFILKYCSGLFDTKLEHNPKPLYAEEFFMLIDNECNGSTQSPLFFAYHQMEKVWDTVLTDLQKSQVIHRICYGFYPVNEDCIDDFDESMQPYHSPDDFQSFKDVWNQIITDHDFSEDVFAYQILGVFTQLLLYSHDFVKTYFRATCPFSAKDITFSIDQMIKVWDEILIDEQKNVILQRLNGTVYDEGPNSFKWFD